MTAGLARKNKRVLAAALGIAAGMAALSYVSVPLYRMVCQVTGWGGTTREALRNDSAGVYAREITVRFNADTARDMPWAFRPDLNAVKVRVGADGIVSFLAENRDTAPVTGTAVYNVTPLKAGKYFYKTQCFCFGQQVLQPGQKVHMPVVFYIDPKIMDDREMDDIHTITLSYTFFRQDSPALEKAVEKFYNEGSGPKANPKEKT